MLKKLVVPEVSFSANDVETYVEELNELASSQKTAVIAYNQQIDALALAESQAQIAKQEADRASTIVLTPLLQLRKSKLDNPLMHLFKKNKLVDTLQGELTWSRSTTATYIDRYGMMKTAEINEARQEEKGWLTEGASTNIVTHSQGNWGDSSYSGGNETIRTNNKPHIDGSNDALLISASATNDSHSINKTNLTIAPLSVVTFSVIVEYAGNQFFNLSHGDFSSWETRGDVTFDLVNGVVALEITGSGSGAIKGHITDLKNGRFLCAMSGGVRNELVTNSHIYMQLRQVPSQSNFVGDGVSGVVIHTVQAEELPFATSYIPTNASPATRTKDIISVPVYNNVNAASDYSVICDYQLQGRTGAGQYLYSTDSVDDGELFFQIGRNGTTTKGTIQQSGRYEILDTANKAMSAITSNVTDLRCYEDGNLIHVESKSIIKKSTGNVFSIGLNLYGYLSDFRVYDFALNADEIALLAGE